MRCIPFRLFFLLIGIPLVVGFTMNGQGVKAVSSCSWIANASSSDYDWNDGNNWSCGVVPDSSTDVIINAPTNSYAPNVSDTRVARTVQVSGFLYIGGFGHLTVGSGWSNSGTAWIDSQGILTGTGEVKPSGVIHFLASGVIDGNLTIDSGATASVDALYAYGNVTNNGNLSSENVDTQFHMLGPLFTNYGTVSTKFFWFEKGGVQHVSGAGTWSGGIASLTVTGPTHLTADSDLNFSPLIFFINNDGSVLDIGAHKVTFNGPSQLGVSGTLTGSTNGTIHTEGVGFEIHIPNGGLFTPPLDVDGGITHAFGTFSGPITVSLDGTLLVMAAPAGSITATMDVTVNGILGGEDAAVYFEMQGHILTVNGLVSVADLWLDGTSQQIITGSGQLNLHRLEVDAPGGLLLSAPLHLDNTLELSGNIVAPTTTITLAEPAVISGANYDKDIFSTIVRTGPFQKDKDYSFGNQYLSIHFANSGTLPGSVTMKVSQSPWAGLRGSIKRSYTIQTSGGSGWSANLLLDYRDNEFLGNADYLQAWTRPSASSPWVRQVISGTDTNQDWIEFDGLTHFSDWGLVINTLCLPVIRK
jgi:hypothetical protein